MDKPKAEHLRLIDDLDHLFTDYAVSDSAESLRLISEYYSYLAKNLIRKGNEILTPLELVSQFESIYLLLQEILATHPESILTQVRAIIEEGKLCGAFAKLSIVYGDIEESPLGRFFAFFLSTEIKSTSNQTDGLSWRQVLSDNFLREARISLTRLAQITKYASRLSLPGSDDGAHGFRQNYDPNLIDKNKVIALVNVLRVELRKLPEGEVNEAVWHRIEEIEQEVRKSKGTRWGFVITSLFVLFGFFADLRTLNPDIYDEPYRIVEKSLSVIHQEGQVRRGREQSLLGPGEESDRKQGEDPSHIPSKAVLPTVSVETRREDS